MFPNFRDYEVAWVNLEGVQYRKDFYERQNAKGTRPLLDNPTVEELVKELEKYEPTSILEIGCGFGRLMQPVVNHFLGTPVTGCDVSQDMLDLCPQYLVTFNLDICKIPGGVTTILKCQWDVAFCRGVFMYFNEEQTRAAVQNISSIVNRKMIVYEWPFVCDRMKSVCPDGEKFEFHEMQEKDE